METKLTYAEIGKLASVSAATVSRVMTGSDTVKEGTKQRVFSVMESLGYDITEIQVNTAAGSRASPIILNLPSIGNPFYTEIVRGAKVAAKQHGYSLLIHEEDINTGDLDALTAMMRNLKAPGFITTNYVNPDILTRLNAVAPVVQCCECDTTLNIPYVTIDDVKAARNVMDYILSTGRRRVAFVNGPMQYKYAKRRLEGYLAALQEAGLPVENELILHLPDINFDLAVTASAKLFESERPPEAVFAVADGLAAGAMKAATRAGLSVPGDVIVVGFDNVDISSMTNPTITTVNQPRYQIGYSCLELLVERINNPSAPVRSTVMEVEMILRESTTSSPPAQAAQAAQAAPW